MDNVEFELLWCLMFLNFETNVDLPTVSIFSERTTVVLNYHISLVLINILKQFNRHFFCTSMV